LNENELTQYKPIVRPFKEVISIFDKYVLKILSAATIVTAMSLTIIVLLTQSIRFLELVISSDASSGYFMLMMGLAVPKFLEAILPIAFAIGTVFACYRLILDREMIVLFASGLSAFRLSRPFLIFAACMMAIQFMLSSFIAPVAVEKLQLVRSDVKSHYATLLFREGVFNDIGPGITAYVEKRTGMNELENLLINDDRGTFNEGKVTTIVAKRGIVNMTDDRQSLLVYNGTQYEKNIRTGATSRLDFDQYTLDIPVADESIGPRWREPDERTLNELFIPKNTTNVTDLKKRGEFLAEANRRLSTPFLYVSYASIVMAFLLLGTWNRRKQSGHVVRAGMVIIAIQALYIVIYNEAQGTIWLSVFMYALAIIPAIVALYCIYPKHKLATI
jgi:lipopolysaccharide export system permease protein